MRLRFLPLLLCAVPAIVHADPDDTPDAIGVQLEWLPFGSIHRALPGERSSASVGITADFEHVRSPHLSVGLSPRAVLNDATHTQQLDLRARIRIHGQVAPSVEAYGSLSPGYTLVTGEDELHGPAITASAGATVALAGNLFVAAEIGEQLARMTRTEDEAHVVTVEHHLHVGLGAGARF